jgi:hypothetical protein
MLTLYSSMAARLGDRDVAIPAAAETRRLATELREPQWEAAADTVTSLIAGMRGDEEAAEEAASQAERIAEPAGANITVAFAQYGRVLAALGAGRHADAYRSAGRLFDPDDSAYHPVICSWLIGDLAEAARRADRSACPTPAQPGPVAATPAPDRRLTRTTAHRPRRLRCPGMRCLERPGPARATRVRRGQPSPLPCRP